MSPQQNTFIVARFVPRDIHRYSHASAAAVLLAAAVGWDVIEKPNRPTILRSGKRGESVVIEIPDQTNLKFGVYRSWINKIVTHSVEFILPLEVAERICDTAKLDPDHRRLIIDLAEQTLIPDATPDAVDENPEPVVLLSREPYKAHLGNASTYTSSASYERIWSDGHRDYECTVCGEAFPQPKSLGGHRQKHIAAGEAESEWRDAVRTKVREFDPDRPDHEVGARNGTHPEPEPILEVEPLDPHQGLVDDITAAAEHEPTPLVDETLDPATLLREQFVAMGNTVQTVLDENAMLKAQLRKMRADLAAMFSLMQELQGPEVP